MENQYSYYNPEGSQYDSRQTPNGEDHKHHKQRKVPKALAVTGLAILFGVVASAVFLASNVVGTRLLGLDNNTSETSSPSAISSAALTQTSSVVTSDVSGVVENVMPSVVSITNMSVQQVRDFFGQVYQQQSAGAGTGIIISQNEEELLIVTNYHVVENSETLTVTFNDESSVEANIKGTDEDHDLAVISVPLESISNDTMDAIAVATLGDSTQLKPGEPAIAIGNALGYGQSVTTGVISAVNRASTGVDATTGETITSDIKLIQTDAAINPGNSGGALVNASGEVIGINSSKLVGTTVEGVGYAIPISDVSDIITDLMNRETRAKVAEADRGLIGIRGLDVTEETAQRYGMPLGVYVSELIEGGGAEKADMPEGCIITKLNGTTVQNMEELQGELEYYEAGETVTVTIQVAGENGKYTEKEVEVTLSSSN